MGPEIRQSGRATGPRSVEGKRRAAQNARRHGLTAVAANHKALEAQVAAWRAGPDGAVLRDELLLPLAEALQRLAQVRSYQSDLIRTLGRAPSDECSSTESGAPAPELHDVKLALRYRAETESMLRKTVRAVIAALERHKQEGAVHGTIRT